MTAIVMWHDTEFHSADCTHPAMEVLTQTVFGLQLFDETPIQIGPKSYFYRISTFS